MEADFFQGANFRVYRVTDPEYGPMLVKKAATPDARERFRAGLAGERRMLEWLQDVPGCPRLLGDADVIDELHLADPGGNPLSQSGLPGHLDLHSFLRIAASLAGHLAAIHERRVIHKNLRPESILIRPDDLSLLIINFEAATPFAVEEPDFEALGYSMEQLRYCSPEQTGRLLRTVDYRTDLYSLGATLYTLATGGPPFADTDRLALMHAHLAREPQPPQALATWLPEPVARVILTLLAKEPDERYQSAAGLRRDLQALSQALEERRPLTSIRLRAGDLPLSPRQPRHLHGRNPELTSLRNAFVAAQQGGALGICVAGYSGVGKTSLIRELRRTIDLGQGWFIQGKFDQFQRNQPFQAPARSLGQLCQQLMQEPQASQEAWRRQALDELGPEISAAFEVVPELAALVGSRPAAPELDPVRAMVRLRGLLVGLVRATASSTRPLIIFLDDLQWADQPSLDFISALLQDSALHGLLLLGAYRDNEVDEAHPLNRLLHPSAAASGAPEVLKLSNLRDEASAALLADMLQMPLPDARSLADLLCQKTGGNPYFTIELVQSLHREGLLRPEVERGVWQWDRARIAAHPVSDNVVEFLVGDLSGSPTLACDALVAAACLGDTCTLGRLALATGAPAAELVNSLMPAVARGVLVMPNLLAFQQAEAGALLRFCHDRMQQAVYQLRDEAWRRQLHLTIARRFAEAAQEPDHVLRAAEHYAQATALIVAPAERSRARQILLDAARHARQAGSFATAERFVRLAIGLLSPASARAAEAGEPSAWEREPDAAFILHTELHLLLYSQSCHAEADAVYGLLASHAATPLQLVAPACIQVMSLSNRTRYDEAVRLAVRLLAELGLTVPLDDPLPSLEEGLDSLRRHVRSGISERLPHRAAADDPRSNGMAQLINRMVPAAYFSHPLAAFWLSVHACREWIETGYRDYFIFPVTCINMAYIALRGDYATGYTLARAALEVGLMQEAGIEIARGQHVFGLLIIHWSQPLEDGLEYALVAFDGLSRGGELEMACFTYFTTLAAKLEISTDLAEVEAEINVALGFARKNGNQHSEQSFLVFQQLVRALRGDTDAHGSFDDAAFDESMHLSGIQGNAMAQAFFHLYRGLSAAFYVDDDALLRQAKAAYRLRPHISGFYPTFLAHLLHALALIRQYRQASATEPRPALQELIGDDLSWIAARAADAPMNFAHLHDWVNAERLDAQGQTHEALLAFEEAMRKASAHQRPWHHAIITESAGRCHLRRGLEQSGRWLLTKAQECYQDWGAQGKVMALRREWPFLGLRLSDSGSRRHGDPLDFQILLNASQALAAERSLPRLVDRVIDLLGQLTGATDVRLLVLDDQGRWFLEGGVRGVERLDRMPLKEAEACGIISAAGIRLALKNLQPVLSEDAVIDSRFGGDPHFAGLSVCSLLGLPVFVQGRLAAFLVLENRLLRSAFTMAHIEPLSILCGQLATSFENIRVLQSLESKVAERTAQLQAATEAKSQFLANMSHEIRTPMNGVLGMAQLLAREPLTANQQEMIASILTAGRSLLSIINDILDLSKIEAGQLHLEPRPFDLQKTLTQVAGIGQVNASAKGIELRLEADPAIAGGWLGDSLRLEQVLFNLMGNAIKFTERGEVVVRVKLEELAQHCGRLRFEVEDTGIGMAAEAVNRLFTPFNQADASITRRFGGTGLGLAISKRLVELMGGEIGVRSARGVGSVFWFDWPAERVEVSPSAEDGQGGRGPDDRVNLQGLHVLVVDDNLINRTVAQRSLQLAGATCTQANDGAQALMLLRDQPQAWDVVLMDIQMPVMDGLAATRAIRGELGLTDLPVIALSAGVMTKERQEALAAGVNDFLPKPMDLGQMAEMIRKYCPAMTRAGPP